MAKFVEIGGLIKKGLGHGVTEKFSKNKDVVSVGYANGRASDIFDEQQKIKKRDPAKLNDLLKIPTKKEKAAASPKLPQPLFFHLMPKACAASSIISKLFLLAYFY